MQGTATLGLAWPRFISSQHSHLTTLLSPTLQQPNLSALPFICRLDPRRAFPDKLKQRLFSQSPVCGLCGQTIHDLALAEVDHMVPHSLGGPTSQDNAQLVHRICNRSKGNRVAAQPGA